MSFPNSCLSLRTALRCLTLAAFLLLALAAFCEPTITVVSPKACITGVSPVFYEAYATNPACVKGIAAIRIYSAPNVNAYTVQGGHLETSITLSPGGYSTVVQAWDNCGGVSKVDVPLTISNTGVPRSIRHQIFRPGAFNRMER